MDIKEVKKTIDSMGNIKVIFEPNIYDGNLISKKKLSEILRKSQVSLRGWNFPHIPTQDQDGTKKPYSIGNGVEFYTAWEKFYEVFRFYQSGQFLAKFALYEDTIGDINGEEIKVGKYLDFLSVIYRFTEIVLFIKNIIENIDIKSGVLTIEINKTKGRELEALFSNGIFRFHGGYICQIDKVIVEKDFQKEEIFLDPLSIGFELIKEVFEDFNWNDYSEQMIKTHQKNLVNRRI